MLPRMPGIVQLDDVSERKSLAHKRLDGVVHCAVHVDLITGMRHCIARYDAGAGLDQRIIRASHKKAVDGDTNRSGMTPRFEETNCFKHRAPEQPKWQLQRGQSTRLARSNRRYPKPRVLQSAVRRGHWVLEASMTLPDRRFAAIFDIV
jgi:hypothetical protein